MPSRAAVTGSLSLLAALVLTVACGGSCGSNSASPASNSSPSSSNTTTRSTPSQSTGANITLPSDLCTLVTADEASTALGTTVAGLGQGGAPIPGACFYGSSSGTTAVLIFAQAYPDATTADQVSPEQLSAIYRGIYGISSAKPVSGIGDKAFEYTATSNSGSNGIAIFVFKSNVVLFIIISPITDSSKIESLARTAAGRLH